jgi:hypothetical protein
MGYPVTVRKFAGIIVEPLRMRKYLITSDPTPDGVFTKRTLGKNVILVRIVLLIYK